MQVSDGKDQDDLEDLSVDDRQNVTITVTNVNEAPVVTGDSTASVKENASSVLASYRATDPEGDTLTWSVDDPANFWISDQGQLYFLSPPSFEDGATYMVDVIATDDDVNTPQSNPLSVTITVENVEEPGVVTISPLRGWVDDTTAFSAALSDDDGSISGTTWQWARSPNGRSSWTDILTATSSSYTVTADDANQYLRATASYTDGLGSDKTASATLQTPVGDAKPGTNTAPVFLATETGTRSVVETTIAGRSVGAPVRATDEDTGDVLTYSLDGTDAALFDIDPATGQIRTRAVLVYNPDPDMADENEYTVTVSVHDGFDAGYSPSTASDATITVTITVTAAPAVVRRPPTGGGGGASRNRSPSFTEGDATTRTVAENTAAGQDIGAPLEAVDPDRGDTLTYTLEGEDSESFDIDAATGQLRTKAALDYETRTSYTLTARVADRRGRSDAMEVTVTVTNVGLSGMAGQYDRDDSGAIDRGEAIAAVVDYFNGVINKEEAMEVVRVYFTD